MDRIFYFMFAVTTFATLFCIFGPTYYLVVNETHKSKDIRLSLDRPLEALEDEELAKGNDEDLLNDLEHEKYFHKTIKSCLPAENKKCNEFIPEPPKKESKKVQRIALIAPPGNLSISLLKSAENMAYEYNNNKKKQNDEIDLEIISTSHVPPYGYGKTHGLTKIIRLVPKPLILQVTDALSSLLQPDESYKNITIKDMKAAFRQILRFHCRLSHVAAHTAIESISFENLLHEPAVVSRQLYKFLTGHESKNDEGEAKHALNDGLAAAETSRGSRLLSHLQEAHNGLEVAKVLDEVLQDELRKTKNFSAWPCLSFWSAGDEQSPNELSPIVQRLAKALSPNCEDPFVNCFVPRDKCEFKGDATCDKTK